MLFTGQHSIPRNLFISNKNQMHQYNQGSHHDQQDHVYGQMRVSLPPVCEVSLQLHQS